MDKKAVQIALGELIRTNRLKKEISQAELAARIGKDDTSISRLENGKVNPTYTYLLQIAQGLEMSISELLKESGK
jgi:putative transcriptional regulator